MAFSHGLMGKSMMDSGKMGSRMARASTPQQKANNAPASGKKASALDGKMRTPIS